VRIVPIAPGLAVADTGVRMPGTQLASFEAPTVADQRPISRVGSEKTGNTFLEVPKPKAPVVPVYRRKQARH
jgi:hypothetical protein